MHTAAIATVELARTSKFQKKTHAWYHLGRRLRCTALCTLRRLDGEKIEERRISKLGRRGASAKHRHRRFLACAEYSRILGAEKASTVDIVKLSSTIIDTYGECIVYR